MAKVEFNVGINNAIVPFIKVTGTILKLPQFKKHQFAVHNITAKKWDWRVSHVETGALICGPYELKCMAEISAEIMLEGLTDKDISKQIKKMLSEINRISETN